MNKINSTLILCLILAGCSSDKSSTNNYLRWIGDIEFNASEDKADFELCHTESNVKQYFNFSQGVQYEGEEKIIAREFQNLYQPVKSEESGLIRIRFIVNCKGETDRFRIISMDNDYNEKIFDEKITSKLLRITKGLTGWKLLPDSKEPSDYYQYLIFKINNGHIKEILP